MQEMTSVAQMLKKYRRESSSALSSEEYAKYQCTMHNAVVGKLPYYDCSICKNKGVVYFIDDDYECTRRCSCMDMRDSLMHIEKNGLKDLIRRYTFQNYETKTPLQKKIKTAAIQFIRDHDGKWFFIGGQVGAGKTHICTVILKEFLKRNVAARYMLWRDEVVSLKAAVNDKDSYQKLIQPIKTAPVLYIDDLFKTSVDEKGVRRLPTSGDINVAFEIINFRYIDSSLVTIISSEWTATDLIRVDEGIGSRICQMSKDYCLSIMQDSDKNYRLK